VTDELPLNHDIAVVVDEDFVAVIGLVCVLPYTGLVVDVDVCVLPNTGPVVDVVFCVLPSTGLVVDVVVCELPNTGLIVDVVICVPSNKNKSGQFLHWYIYI